MVYAVFLFVWFLCVSLLCFFIAVKVAGILVICGVRVPGMTGAALCSEIHHVHKAHSTLVL